MSLKIVCVALVVACMYYTCEGRHVTHLSSQKAEDVYDENLRSMQMDEDSHRHLSKSDPWFHHHHGEHDTLVQRSHLKPHMSSEDEEHYHGVYTDSLQARNSYGRRRGQGVEFKSTTPKNHHPGSYDSDNNEDDEELRSNRILKKKQTQKY